MNWIVEVEDQGAKGLARRLSARARVCRIEGSGEAVQAVADGPLGRSQITGVVGEIVAANDHRTREVLTALVARGFVLWAVADDTEGRWIDHLVMELETRER